MHPMKKIRQSDEMVSNWEMNKPQKEIFNSNQKEWTRVAMNLNNLILGENSKL